MAEFPSYRRLSPCVIFGAVRHKRRTLRRIRSKILQVRRLALQWMLQNGESDDIMQALARLNYFLELKHIHAGEQELDGLISRLLQRTAHKPLQRFAA
jgi:hypothetical protein